MVWGGWGVRVSGFQGSGFRVWGLISGEHD